jgi:hypothetical protein
MLLLYLLVKVTITQSVIELEYSRVYDSIFLDIGFGNPPINGEIEVNMNMDYNWVSPYYYSPDKSSTAIPIANTSIEHYSKYFNATIYKDTLFIFYGSETLHKIDNMTFYYIEDKISKHYEFLTFAFRAHDSHSGSNSNFIVPLLKSKHLIPKASFALKTNGRYLGDVYLGGIPLTYASTHTYIATIPIIIEDEDIYTRINWGFNLHSITFSNISTYNNNYQYAYFDIKEAYIHSPRKFIEYLKNNILHVHIINNKCKVVDDHQYDKYTFKCEREILILLPEVYININKYMFKFKPNEWFDCYGQSCECVFTLNTRCESEWIFGLPFIKDDIIEFDYDSSEARLYSRNAYIFRHEVDNVNSNSNNTLLIKVIIKYICLLLILNTLMNMFIIFNKHK